MNKFKIVIVVLLICLANPSIHKGISLSAYGGTYNVVQRDSMVYEEYSLNGINNSDTITMGNNNSASYYIKGKVTLDVTVVTINKTVDLQSHQTYNQVFIKEELYLSGQKKYTSSDLTQNLFQILSSQVKDPLHDIYIIPAFKAQQEVDSSYLGNILNYPAGYSIGLGPNYFTISIRQETPGNSSLATVYTNDYNWHTGWLVYKEVDLYYYGFLESSTKTEKIQGPTIVQTVTSTSISGQKLSSMSNEQLLLVIGALVLVISVIAVNINLYKNYKKFKEKINTKISFWSYYKKRKTLKIPKDRMDQHHPQDIDKALDTIENILKENSE